jgi:hypothetical protein
MRVKAIIAVAGGVAAFLVAYLTRIRPWQLRWGATDEEVLRFMPGDEVVSNPSFDATRAVTIHAQPEEIWPWIAQMGFRRAGWYSYDWVDNYGRPSAREIIPEHQDVKVGDLVPMGPGEESGLWIRAFDPSHWMLWADKDGNVTWCWSLYPAGGDATRLVSRIRMRYNWTSPWMLFNLLLDAGDIVMMRKSMLGIKERAEAPAASSGATGTLP